VYSLEQAQRIEAPLDVAFAFFADPRNLARITPPWLSFRIHGEPPRELGEGSRIEYRIRWMGLRLRWVTRITRWRAGVEFQDVQEKGPYSAWIHTHRFSQQGSSVFLEDRVDYALPFGVLGRMAHAFAVRRQLENIFAYRRKAIEAIFASGAESTAAR